tara:strand:- start:1536 stop:1868 length:333 start_codon:yes stop_codon:yes gene_type:complete
MKRKDTSKLLNEWKNFLNEVENSGIEQSQSPDIDFSSYEDPRGVNEDIKDILSSMSEEIGLVPDQITAVLDKLSKLSAEQIAAAAEYHNARAFSSEPLEHDEDLSLFPEE